MDALQALRDTLGKPMLVLSGYRSPAHNRAVGGAPASKHMDGTPGVRRTDSAKRNLAVKAPLFAPTPR